MREVRIAKNVTLTKLAQLSGYDLHTLGNWERGYAAPSIVAFADVVEALGLTIELRGE